MDTLFEMLGLFFPGAFCGCRGAVGRVFTNHVGFCNRLFRRWNLSQEIAVYEDLKTFLKLQEEEETHGCILNFQTMRQVYTHDELESVLVQFGWEPLAKQGGWRRYFKAADATVPHGLATIAKLPARSFVDAPKHLVLDFVKTVNRRENRNVLCCWEHRGQLPMLGWERTLLSGP